MNIFVKKKFALSLGILMWSFPGQAASLSSICWDLLDSVKVNFVHDGNGGVDRIVSQGQIQMWFNRPLTSVKRSSSDRVKVTMTFNSWTYTIYAQEKTQDRCDFFIKATSESLDQVVQFDDNNANGTLDADGGWMVNGYGSREVILTEKDHLPQIQMLYAIHLKNIFKEPLTFTTPSKSLKSMTPPPAAETEKAAQDNWTYGDPDR